MNYNEGIEFLYSLQKYGIKFGLSKTTNLLKSLGDPHKGQKYVHIAGTNGKGSMAAFLASILKESGLKVGLYTSPHLVRFTERFMINGEEINRDRAAELINLVTGVFAAEEPPTFFEAVTAMALSYFAWEKTDIAVIEVGMGGRLDATNVIRPLVCAITNISKEHQYFLGSRLLDIAGEKAGIIKPGVDIVTGATQPPVLDLFETTALAKGAPIWRLGRDVRYRSTGCRLHYYGLKRRFRNLEIGLEGAFQRRNAALALAAAERLEEKGFRISEDHIRQGLKNTKWPGRIHVISKEPAIVLDGSHNPAAVNALAKSLQADFTYRRLILVIGVMEDKDIDSLLRAIVPMADYVIYTRPVYPRAAAPETLMAKAFPLGKAGEAVQSLPEAIEKARGMAQPEDLIVLCGSLFIVGEALTYFDPELYRED